MQTITRAALVDAATDINRVLRLDPAIDVKRGVRDLRSDVAEAAQCIRGDGTDRQPDLTHLLAEGTRAVLAALAEGGGAGEKDEATSGAEKAPAKPKPGVKSGDARPGKFAPIGRDTGLGRIVASLIGEPKTAAAVGAEAGLKPDEVLASLRRARRNVGIDYEVGEGGVVSIRLPSGVTEENLWVEVKASRPAKESRASRAATPKSPKAGNGGAKSRYGDADVIKLLVKENPKKKGSAAYALWELYRDGMTCGEYLKAGGIRAAFSWDTSHGFIKIEKKAA